MPLSRRVVPRPPPAPGAESPPRASGASVCTAAPPPCTRPTCPARPDPSTVLSAASSAAGRTQRVVAGSAPRPILRTPRPAPCSVPLPCATHRVLCSPEPPTPRLAALRLIQRRALGAQSVEPQRLLAECSTSLTPSSTLSNTHPFPGQVTTRVKYAARRHSGADASMDA